MHAGAAAAAILESKAPDSRVPAEGAAALAALAAAAAALGAAEARHRGAGACNAATQVRAGLFLGAWSGLGCTLCPKLRGAGQQPLES